MHEFQPNSTHCLVRCDQGAPGEPSLKGECVLGCTTRPGARASLERRRVAFPRASGVKIIGAGLYLVQRKDVVCGEGG